MRALTIRQPWAWAIFHAGKDVENRSWLPPADVIGERIAVHASAALDRQAHLAYINIADRAAPSDLPRGVVIGSVEVAGWVGEDGSCSDPALRGSLRSRWFVGPYGWVLQNPQTASVLIECRGMLGLWRLPQGVTL